MKFLEKVFGKKDEKSVSIHVDKDNLKINGEIFSFPFPYSKLKEILGEPTRIHMSSGKPNEDGYVLPSRYSWDSLGIDVLEKFQGSVVELNLQISKTKTYPFSPEIPFNGELLIDGKPYQDMIKIKKKDYLFVEFNVGEMEISVRIADEKEEGCQPQEIMSICICQTEPKPKSIKKNPYQLKKEKGETIEFEDFNFKLLVIEELMYNQEILKPKFDIYEFIEYAEREIDPDEEGFEPIPEAMEYFRKLEIPKKWAEKVTELYQDGGNDIYMQISPQWDGEDDIYNVQSYEDVKHFPKLKRLSVFSIDDEVRKQLENKGIKIEY